ncbi:MAG: hypothetical protein MUF58_00955 [Arcicella sp.]|jgi:hypothetical protein|nr:hypothetical protein [Arcicella sp.]
MKTILELDINETQEKLLKEMLSAMNISFSNYTIEEREFAFEQGGATSEIKEAVDDCFGIWKDRKDFTDFQDFRRQAWGGRGVR